MQSVQTITQGEAELSCLNIALVGGGSGGKGLIKFLETHRLRNLHLCIVGVADLSEDAPGVVYARKKGIYTTTDYRDFFSFTSFGLLLMSSSSTSSLPVISMSKWRSVKEKKSL